MTAVMEDEALAEQGEEASLLAGCRNLLRAVTKVSCGENSRALIFMASAKQRKELKCSSGICCFLVLFKIVNAVYYHNLNINAHILVAG